MIEFIEYKPRGLHGWVRVEVIYLLPENRIRRRHTFARLDERGHVVTAVSANNEGNGVLASSKLDSACVPLVIVRVPGEKGMRINALCFAYGSICQNIWELPP